MKKEAMRMKKDIDEKVDTHVKIIHGDQDELHKSQHIDRVYIYTTAHLGAAHNIHDFIIQMLNRKAKLARLKRMNRMAKSHS